MSLHQTRPHREVKFWIDDSTAGTSQEVVVTSLSINNVPTTMRLLPQFHAETAVDFAVDMPDSQLVNVNVSIESAKYILRGGICFFAVKVAATALATNVCSFQFLLPRFVADQQLNYPITVSRQSHEDTYPADTTARSLDDTVVVEFSGELDNGYTMIIAGSFPYR